MSEGRANHRPGVVGSTMCTRVGTYFDFLFPDPSTICRRDIAWALSHVCRFNGHCTSFYSVAQHSVLVSHLVPAPLQFEALLHDAAEAYVGDVVAPLKQLLPDFKAIEKRVERAIADRYGLPHEVAPEIKHADLRLLRTEQRDLTAAAGDYWPGLDGFEPLAERIVPLAPLDALQLFNQRWLETFDARRRA